MIILGIDPGSLTAGWALLEVKGNKTSYLDSGVLQFNSKTPFLERTVEIKTKFKDLLKSIKPDEVALESLIFVKSPTALIKLAQTRGIMLGELAEKYENKIFEYSPNLVKSTAVGHGHADKEGVRKFLDMVLGKQDYKTHDESDACAVALCHIINRGKPEATKKTKAKSGGSSLKSALAHKIG